MVCQLIVSLDEVALVRQAQGGQEPDPVAAAVLAQMGGAHGVCVHLREDRAHVQDRDARILRQTVRDGFGMDVAALPEMLKVVLEVRPDSAILVPEAPGELRSSGGLDVQSELAELGEMLRALEDGGISAGLLIDADLEQVKAAHRIGACQVQLATNRFAEHGPDRDEELERLRDAARLAAKLGLEVWLGGGLDARSLTALRGSQGIRGFRIGHAVAARGLLVGLERAVREFVALVR